MNKQFWGYVGIALGWSLLFGEILGPLAAHHDLPLLRYPGPFLIYYFIITLIFAWCFKKLGRWSLIIVFLYGFVGEWLLFHNVSGPTDILGILFFGCFYLFLFGLPAWFARKIFKDN
jgi:hypothetical protein